MKDREFLVLLVIFGCICLTVTNSWHVYTEPLQRGGSMLLEKLGIEESQGNSQTDDSKENEPEQEPENESEELLKEEPENEEVMEEHPEDKQEPEGESEPVIYQTVEDDYFADAVFIGDSRTVGLYDYSSLKDTSTFYASVGLSVHKLFKAKIVEVPGQRSKITVEEALSQKQFAKVYLMIGINEMGTGTVESFLEKYQECVNRIRQLQPDAIIYLQGIMQVTEERSAQGDYITIEGIAVRNEGIKAMADDETIFYLEVNEAVCDENGGMNGEYTHDGVHLKAQYIDLWKDYLKNHAIVRE